MIKFINFLVFLRCLALVSSLNDANDLLLHSEEKFALDKFKIQVEDQLPEDFMKTDYYLIRWLRAADLDIPRAQTMLLENVKWRKRNNISQILTEDFSDLQQDFPMTFGGHDKEGRPIMTIDFGDWDVRLAVFQGKAARLQRYLTQGVERNLQNIFKAQKMHKSEKPITRSLVLVDADGFNAYIHACIPCLAIIGNWAVVGSSYYPMFNDEVIIINAPQAAVIALNGIKPLMSEETRNSIKVFNSQRQVWSKYLDQRIDRNQRTKRYGGTK